MMENTPKNIPILIVGRGRLSKHLAHYFSLKNIPFSVWYRAQDCSLKDVIDDHEPQKICLAISDDAIQGFYEDYASVPNKTWIHFSGAKTVPGVIGIHPLMTFGEQLYDLALYESIPLVVEAPHRLEQVFPFLDNPTIQLEAEQKALYHAMATLAGPGVITLWQEIMGVFSKQLGIPPSMLELYTKQAWFNNFQTLSPITGAWVREDEETIKAHHQSLVPQGDLGQVYQALHTLHQNRQALKEETSP